MRGVTFRFSHIGGAAGSVFAAPRKREGRNEDPSILVEVQKELRATIKPSTGPEKTWSSAEMSIMKELES